MSPRPTLYTNELHLARHETKGSLWLRVRRGGIGAERRGPKAGRRACIEECMRYTKRTARKKSPTTKHSEKRFKKKKKCRDIHGDEESKSDITTSSVNHLHLFVAPTGPPLSTTPFSAMQKAVLPSVVRPTDHSLTSVSSLLLLRFGFVLPATSTALSRSLPITEAGVYFRRLFLT